MTNPFLEKAAKKRDNPFLTKKKSARKLEGEVWRVVWKHIYGETTFVGELVSKQGTKMRLRDHQGVLCDIDTSWSFVKSAKPV